MFQPPPPRSRKVRIADATLFFVGLVVLIILVTVYQMPFRLDDVLHMDWAREHSFWDAFHPVRGEIVRSFRPVFAAVIWILTHTAGTEHYWPWHLTLVASFFIGLAYAGLTARYISRSPSALQITVIIFWISFLPILNVLFWFGDLTFTIELMFVAAAWYYGLRGICEARLGMWFLGCFLGILAVLSKEPAIVMVNAVLLSPLAFYSRDIFAAWKPRTTMQRSWAVVMYLAFITVCFIIFFASPTKSNRFFNVSALPSHELNFYIGDRLRYYGELFGTTTAYILLIPLCYLLSMAFTERFGTNLKSLFLSGLFVIPVILSSSNVLVVITIYITFPIIAYFVGKQRSSHLLLLTGFGLTLSVIFCALLITVMLVKTQITEFAICASVISGCAWSYYLRTDKNLPPKKTEKSATWILRAAALILTILFSYFMIPRLFAREALLREVQATRHNANDAIKWMARHLPQGSTVLVTAQSLYGSHSESDLTGLDDDFKAFAQYTFPQGFVRVYFWQLERPDLQLAYIEDSTMLHTVLDAFRHEGKAYLFLQSGRDYQRFHQKIAGREPLTNDDARLIEFVRGAYPTEVWQIGR